MSKQFRCRDLKQAYVVPPLLQDWLPENALAWFAAEVVEMLDLSEIYAYYEAGDKRGLARVQAEWKMTCATHNLLKLFQAEWSSESA